MNERLEQLCFVPPPTDAPWLGTTGESQRVEINRESGDGVKINLPLFWCDPPWHQLRPDLANALACGVARHGVTVAALRSELSTGDAVASFFSQSSDASPDNESDRVGAPYSRILPYRPERYGLSDLDFDDASIVDVRLTMRRDNSGRFAFSPDQIQRWEATSESAPLAGGGWVPAATFPPDVKSLRHLSSKLNQIRILSPSAAVFVSIGPYRLEKELPRIIAAKPDGLILRLDELQLDGLQLAMTTRCCCDLVRESGAADLPVWIAPGPITPDDAVKLIALGASGIAIDHWCEPMVQELTQATPPAPDYGYSRPSGDDALLGSLVENVLSGPVNRFVGLMESMQGRPPLESLAALSRTWASALNVAQWSLLRTSEQG